MQPRIAANISNQQYRKRVTVNLTTMLGTHIFHIVQIPYIKKLKDYEANNHKKMITTSRLTNRNKYMQMIRGQRLG